MHRGSDEAGAGDGVGRPQLAAGSKAPRLKTVQVVTGATRAGQGARYLWKQLLARMYGVYALTSAGDE